MSDAQLVANHVYVVTAVDTAHDTITLTNPYTTRDQRTVTLSLGDLAKNADTAAVIAP